MNGRAVQQGGSRRFWTAGSEQLEDPVSSRWGFKGRWERAAAAQGQWG